jgi:formamidopyrimidine-DNA glycosylase
MPELPEVETVVRALRKNIRGARLDRVVYASRRVDSACPRRWRQRVPGQTIETVTRRGKFIVMMLSDRAHLVVHLRMTGRFRLRRATHSRDPHDRLILAVSGGRLKTPHHLVFVDTRQFGRVDWCAPGALDAHPGLARLGPDANKVTHADFRRILASSRRPIKPLLLDQTQVAGLGNIYVDESLHAARIHPETRSGTIGPQRVRRLHVVIGEILDAAIRACGTTFDTFSDLSGTAGGFAPQLTVYQRTGLPCISCARPIRRITLAGRGTHFCPQCQRR